MTTPEVQINEPIPLEIERKFIIDELPVKIYSYEHREIKQGYLVIDQSGSEVRLRHEGTDFSLTVKTGGNLVRGEWETVISTEQFNLLLPATAGKRIEKTRYRVPYGSVVIEVDIYTQELHGLITAEIEFPNETYAYDFVPPAWLTEDVTQNPQFRNRNLAQYIYGVI